MKRQFLIETTGNKIKTLSGRFSKLFLLLSLFTASQSFGNNLSVANISYDLTAQTVTFDLSWNNSWHNKSGIPNNWDAAWVFVKWRDCFATNATGFTHGSVSTTLGDHDFNVGAGATTYQPTREDGTVGIDDSPDNTGVMLRNINDPFSGTNSATVRLKMLNLPAPGATLDMRVFGIEMVYVPTAPFMAGDSSHNSASVDPRFWFTGYFTGTTSTTVRRGPAYITSENAQTIYEFSATASFTGQQCTSPQLTCNLSAGFPKGYNPFFMMKYEITQGQYVDFLNTSHSAVQTAHFTWVNIPPQGWSWTARHTIRDTATQIPLTGADPNFYPTPFIHAVGGQSRGDRACNFLSWSDVSTYLDWAALRPLTELEYEKACRGINMPIQYEYAWGNTTYTNASSITGVENGTETVNVGANINAQNSSFSVSGGATETTPGPIRVGIFALPGNTTRQQSGMGYYGAMELSGNVMEYYISVRAGLATGNFTDNPSQNGIALGDGNVGPTGTQDEASWPNPYNVTSPYVLNTIRRGGSWASGAGNQNLSVSYRQNGSTITRDNTMGGRGGR